MSIELAAGTVIGGDYRVERELGVGGMGSVFVAEQLSTGKRRALKVMRRELVSDTRSRQRFIEEAKVGSRIRSAHVVEVVGAGVDEPTGAPWLAMELLEGQDLDAYVTERGPRPIAEVAELFEQLAHALGEAHRQGVIHRDLKPENLFLAKSRRVGEKPMLKVLDFGIATFVASDKTAATVTSAIGSPLWIAPEQTSTGAKLRPATDVWAMGLIAFYLLTAKSYWPAANHEPFNMNALIVEIVAHPLVAASQRAAELGVGALPPGFDGWFARCVVRDPTERFADASEAAAALTAVVSEGASAHSTTSSASPVQERTSTGPRSDPGPVAAARGPTPQTLPMDGGGAPGSQPGFGPGSQPGFGPGSQPGFGPMPSQPGFGPMPTAAHRGRSRRPLLAIVFGSVGLFALVAMGGAAAIAAMSGGGASSDEPLRTQPAQLQGFAAHLAACREALDSDAPWVGIAAADEALRIRPGDADAIACRERARALEPQAEAFQAGVHALDRDDFAEAYSRFDELPEDSPYRARPEVGLAASSYAAAEIEEGRLLLSHDDPEGALACAERAIAVEPLSDRERGEAERLATDAREALQAASARDARPAAAPRAEPPGREPAEPPGRDREARPAPTDTGGRSSGGGSAGDRARACSLRGDTACVVRELEGGRASNPNELSMLIEAYRAQGQSQRALGHMRTFVQRYPSHPRARHYQQILQVE